MHLIKNAFVFVTVCVHMKNNHKETKQKLIYNTLLKILNTYIIIHQLLKQSNNYSSLFSMLNIVSKYLLRCVYINFYMACQYLNLGIRLCLSSKQQNTKETAD